jgi:hypothetical protein
MTGSVLGVALCAALSAACSGGGGDGPLDNRAEVACALVDRLASTADIVTDADVADPDAFQRALDEGVSQYVSVIDDLRAVVPDRLGPSLDRLEAAVEQYDFDEALAARAPLDEYAAATCTNPTSTTTA